MANLKERRLGTLEKFQVARQLVKAYGNVCLTVKLKQTYSLQELQEALERLLPAHPSLSLIVPNPTDPNPHFERLPAYQTPIQTVPDQALSDLLQNEIRTEFDLTSQSPLWRLVRMGDWLTLTAHHVIMDGISLTIFWRDYLLALKGQRFGQVELRAAYEPQATTGMMGERPDGWRGDETTEDHWTLIQTWKVEFGKVMEAAKIRRLSVHAILYVIYLRTWAKLFGDGQRTVVETPINCRVVCNPPEDGIGNYVAMYTSLWTSERLLEEDEWVLAKEYGEDLKRKKVEVCSRPGWMNKLRYPEEFKEIWYKKRQEGKCRVGGLILSDLGLFEGEGLEEVYFSQSIDTFDATLKMSTITLGQTLYCTLNWQKDSLNELKINSFHNLFMRTIKELIL